MISRSSRSWRYKVLQVSRDHFIRAALEIGQNGENDTLPYDVDARFVKEKSSALSDICFSLFQLIDARPQGAACSFVDGLTIWSERLLTPSGSHGFRITTRIHPFWNLYLNGLGLAIAEANEKNRSPRAHSYRLANEPQLFFDKARSWRTYKEATLNDKALEAKGGVVVQTDIAGFYEHIYHHRLEGVVKDLGSEESTVATQIDRILNKLSSGRSFGLPVGGQCARILAEVMMTPIDRSLSEAGVVWHRYVDDFTLICRSQQDAYQKLSMLSYTLADYGLSLNRTKTTILSTKHYNDYVSAQLGRDEEASAALIDLDLHFDPYSDSAEAEYDDLKKAVNRIDFQFLLDLEKDKSQPDSFVIAQIGRSLKFQEPAVAYSLCSTLLDKNNLDSFRASWSKIMRGVYSIRANNEFQNIFDRIDLLLDRVPRDSSHLLTSDVNKLHFMRVIRFVRSDERGEYVRNLYDSTSSPAIRRACIDCWSHWHDRASFTRVRSQWESLNAEVQRMFWLAAGDFDDQGQHARNQLRRSLAQAWRLGFEAGKGPTFASCFRDWAGSGA